MATWVKEGQNGDLECPHCLDFITDPVTLSCGHSLCRKCLTDCIQTDPTAVARKIFPCSVCRQDTPVPDPRQSVTEWGKQLNPSLTIRRHFEQVKTAGTDKSARKINFEAGQKRLPESHLLDLDDKLDLDGAKQMLLELGHIAANFASGQDKRTTEASTNVSRPILITQIEGDKERPALHGITVMNVGDVEALVVTDSSNEKVKCFYSTSRSTSQSIAYSVYQMEKSPWGVAKLKDNMVMVSIPDKRTFVTFHVTPDLVKQKITTTLEDYWSLEMMDNGQLVAGTGGPFGPGRVDVLDVSGNTATRIRSLPTRHSGFRCPIFLTVNKQDRQNIIISDTWLNKLTSVTSEGRIKWTYRPKFQIRSVTTTQTGDVVIVESSASPKIVVFTKLGVHKTDLLTAEDSEITDPWDVHCDDRGYLYIVDQDRVLVYKLSEV